jgi:membrane protein YqaA with SNARE-associated domain
MEPTEKMTDTTTTVERPKGWRGLHYRMYDWVLKWSAHTRAQTALFLMALAEASFFPIPPDVLLIAMGVAKPKRTFRFAAICSAGSLIGGVLGYLIGWGLWSAVDDLFYRYIPGFSPEVYQKVAGLYQQYDFWIVFTAGFTPLPYKVFTIAAGVAHIGFVMFLVASVISRSARFFLVAWIIRKFGPKALPFIEKHLGWLSILFVVLLGAGFYALKFLH